MPSSLIWRQFGGARLKTPPFAESVFKIDYFFGFEQAINNNADYNKPKDGRATQYLSPMSKSRRIRNQWPTQSINTLRLKVTGQWGEAIALTAWNVPQLKEPINFQPLWAVNISVPMEDMGAVLVSGREGAADCAVLTLLKCYNPPESTDP